MIYRIMLVEDEPPTMRNIERTISKCPNTNDFLIAAKADNGLKALQLIPVVWPHIILSDVKMPIMDGFELIEQVRRQYPNIQVAILSGYQEFEYFKKALHYQLTDYLLKPINQDELSALLSHMKASARQVVDREIDNYIHAVVDNRPATKVPEQAYKHFCIMVLNAGWYCQSENWEDVPPLAFLDLSPLIQALAELSCDHSLWLYPSNSANRLVAVIGFDDLDSRIIEKALTQIHTGATLTVAYAYVDILHDMPTAFRRVYKLMQEGLIPHRSQLINADTPMQQPMLIGLSLSEEARLLDFLQAKNVKGFLDALHRILLGKFSCCTTQMCIQRVYNDVLVLLKKHLVGMSNDEIVSLESLLAEVIHSTADIDTFVKELCDQICIFVSQYNQNASLGASTEEVVGKVQHYIETHYNHPISLLAIALQFGISYCYLSTLYKKYCGLSPSKHLVKLRINKAKDLIAGDKELSFRQIALLVGYEDAHYFSRMFRNMTGMSPTEYRERIGNEYRHISANIL